MKTILLLLSVVAAVAHAAELNAYKIESTAKTEKPEKIPLGWYEIAKDGDSNGIEIKVDGKTAKVIPLPPPRGYAYANMDKIDDFHRVSVVLMNKTIPKELFFISGGTIYLPDKTIQTFRGQEQTFIQFDDADSKKITKLYAELLKFKADRQEE